MDEARIRFPPGASVPRPVRSDSTSADCAAMEIGGLRVTHVSMEDAVDFGSSATLTFDADSAARIAAFTAAHAGVRVQVLVDEVVVFEPRILACIPDGVLVAAMGTKVRVERLVDLLNVPGAALGFRIAH